MSCSAANSKKVVILIDEYDKLLLDNISDTAIALEMREGLKNFYSVIKECDGYIRFVFMTGVSKFSKVSIFSGLNNLIDITTDERYSTVCGYTQTDLDTKFKDYLAGCELDELKKWYNGYSWLGESVYNPFDILLFISRNFSYRNYWFETGSPAFLIRLFQKNRYFLPSLEELEVTEETLDSFDIERINPLTILFQAGYLTIDHVFTRRRRMMFALKVPNLEVKIALNDQFINAYTDLDNEKIGFQDDLFTCLSGGDLDGMVGVIQRLFAGIPWRNFTKNDLAEAEGYYASVLYAFFSSLDAVIIPEDTTSHGQVDMAVKLENHIYVMEIKVVNAEVGDALEPNPALEQIREKGYAAKYPPVSG